MDEEQERSLHGSISRYMTGVENAGGFLLVPEDIGVTSLGVDPDKAQLLGLKNLSGRDVARMFKMPPSWLGIEGASAYKSQVQDAQDYVNRCQMPMTVEFEQAIYIHLIVARDYFAKFNMDYLLRADLKTRMQAYEIGIRSRILWPSEARAREDMNPDDELDALAAADHRAGSPRNGSSGSGDSGDEEARRRQSAVGAFNIRTTIIALGNAERVIRRERAAVERLAKKHPSDVEAWRDGLRSFFEDHAGFVAETMHLPMGIARAYAAQHGAALEGHGIGLMSEHWEREESEALTMLALDPPPERQAA